MNYINPARQRQLKPHLSTNIQMLHDFVCSCNLNILTKTHIEKSILYLKTKQTVHAYPIICKLIEGK